MKIVSKVSELRALLAGSASVALVPTMGNLHDGHLKLVEHARGLADTIVTSIFVNPLQFGPNEDFDRYPRTFPADCARLEAAGNHVVFAPTVADLYPEEQTYRVKLPSIQDELCGKFRPGHFEGVATVVLKLFNCVQPQVAMFGRKDYQQLLVIRQMVTQFNLPIVIQGVDTHREADGLAMSSRNGYLDADERRRAVLISKVLRASVARLEAGERDFVAIEQAGTAKLTEAGWRVDYVAIRRADDLAAPGADDRALVVLAAAWLGRTRLIDNVCCEVPARVTA